MKRPDLNRIKSSLQNIKAKKVALTRDMENLRSYYKYQSKEMDEASESLILSFSGIELDHMIDCVNELIDLEEDNG
jgi:hypothetical protein